MNRATLVRAALWGLLKRCPKCGEGKIFQGWFALVPRCPRCGLVFEREEGYWTGAMAINIGVTELVFVIALVAGLVLTWPAPPVAWLLAVTIAINALFPVVFYPFSKTIWISIDLALHALDERESAPGA
ncbi:DUF983 domain-containing protein [Thermomicrobiaceae bacterium CFH 74404]|uniref:DUF983 domain-containing protein n=1 Tax=Thermalbibacter longus TaxID=2951981 RepID=A0AA41WCJ9_9BACT|nr:DUF983 domain-containing protein [Thermalbibacter longus]MCM8747553.1 DUF983 domain-containing protein [Thermalbibacter longus]